MDLGDLITRISADASKYNRVLDQAIDKAYATAASINRAFAKVVSGDMSGQLGKSLTNPLQSSLTGAVNGLMSLLTMGLSAAFSAASNVIGSVFGGAVKMAEVGLLALVAVVGVATYKAVELAAEYEQASIAFEVMTGSADQAQQVLSDITKLAIQTPFTSQALVKNAQQLASFGIEADQLVPTLRTLGDVTAGGSGGSLDERMGRLSLAFGQVMTAGRLMGTELRQFNEAGVPLIKYLAQTMNQPEQSIKGLVEAGRVGANDVIRAFNAMTAAGGMFAGMMEKQSQTVAGRWSTLKDSIQVLLRNAGLAFFKGFGLSDLLKEFSDAVDGATGSTAKLEEMFAGLRKVFDVIRAMGTGLGGTVLDKLFGTAPDWNNVAGLTKNVIEGLIRGVAKILDFLKQAAVFILESIVAPIVGTMQDLGIIGSSGGAADWTL